jgi:two-component system phosphate regulon sensor histidine kinase PhoR
MMETGSSYSSEDSILVVDDTINNLKMLSAILTEAGHRVRTASSGALALRSIQACLPALILLDVKMPKMDGFAVCRRLKEDEQTKSVPVIFITGVDSARERVAGFQAGAVDYIMRPFDIQEVLARVSTHLALRRAQVEWQETNARLIVEIGERREVEAETQRLLDQAERSRRVLLSILEDRKRAEESERAQHARTAALVRVAALLNAQLDLDAVLNTVCAEAARTLEVPIACVHLYDSQRDALVMAATFGAPPQYRECAPLIPRSIFDQGSEQDGSPVVIPDVRLRSDFPDADETASANLRTLVFASMARERQLIGAVSIVTVDQPRQFTGDELALLRGLADQATQAIINARLYDTTRQYANEMEQRVVERTTELHTQLARLEAILNSSTDGVIVTTADGEITLANPVAQRWLDGTLSAHDAQRLRQTVRDLVAQAAQRPTLALELGELDLQLSAAPVVEATAAEQSCIVMLHDVSQLKALDRMRSAFISNVSHELRTPATTIKLGVGILRHSPMERWDFYLQLLEVEAERLARLVDEILQVSRIESGRLELRPAMIDLNEFAHAIVEGRNVIAMDRGLDMICETLAPALMVQADPDRLQEIANNLVENAIWYTPRGGKVTVSTGSGSLEGRAWAFFSVRDTGIGIPKEELPLIFERFYRGEQPRSLQIAGSGLGLSIVQDLVQLLGGRIVVQSQVGTGSTFTVWLPLVS